MSRGPAKQRAIDELIEEFRASGSQENAFDTLAAARLGINRTDLDCVSIVQRRGGVTAGELAEEAGLTTGAVTGVIDRLERAGYARRVPDPSDRRRIKVEVTPEFYAAAEEIWAPMAREWEETLSRYTVAELDAFAGFLRASNEIGRRHAERIREG